MSTEPTQADSPEKTLANAQLIDAGPLLAVLRAIRRGTFSVRLPMDQTGMAGAVAEAFNDVAELLEESTRAVERVSHAVGKEGQLSQRASLPGASGGWAVRIEAINQLISNLMGPTAEVSRVIGAVARGDLSQRMATEIAGQRLEGEFLRLGNTVNTMVEQLGSFASEVTRVAREVGTEGKLGGQAAVVGVGGTWKDLTDNVNGMAANLTSQVRNIAEVTTAVATGDLSKKITVDVKGEILELKNTINTMVNQLGSFASEVTRVAREVGTDGKLGGQANVKGVAGTWKDLTDNVNGMAANLTAQVRAIAEVATSVTRGDMNRSITVEARGEVDDLKNNINQMIGALRDTTQRNTEQDWLKTNLADFSRALQGQRDLQETARQILSKLGPLVQAQHGVFYAAINEGARPELHLLASYAYKERKGLANRFQLGEGLVGQCALEKERILVTDVPADYVHISSGLGDARPYNLVVLPIVFEGKLLAVIELASFNRLTDIRLAFLDQLAEGIGIGLNSIQIGTRTEDLLKKSQALSEELQSQQEELRETNLRLEKQAESLQSMEELRKGQQQELQRRNEELEDSTRQMARQQQEVLTKNREIEQAKAALQERAEQLAITSRYKSEFLANMSHELRTPLNSQLILSQLLGDNEPGNLTTKQVDFARTIHASGMQLLSLIDEILDMAKIESGTITVEPAMVSLADLRGGMDSSLRPQAEGKGLGFAIELAADLPAAIFTDGKRLRQVLGNLLGNACKFTDKGSVGLRIGRATQGWSADHRALNAAGSVLAFAVTDTGIGIAADKLKVVFEPFQQATGGTARKYGGTGLGLSISREIATLLGGEIRVASTVGQGSTFTLYLPEIFRTGMSPAPAAVPPRPLPPPADAEPRPLALAQASGQPAAQSRPGEQVLLIIEDDPVFAGILAELARDKGFQTQIAANGKEALELVREIQPAAITLDLRLPDIDGWVVLDNLKHDPATRHIPVHIVSVEADKGRGRRGGVVGHLVKPVTKEEINGALDKIREVLGRPIKSLLVVEDKEMLRAAVVELLTNDDLHLVGVGTGAGALAALKESKFDCLLLDLRLPDISGFEVLARIRTDPGLVDLPIIVCTGKELTDAERTILARQTEAVILKQEPGSMERILEETMLFLHRVEADLPKRKQERLQKLRETEPGLAGRKVLIVDDDVRNLYSLTALLEKHQMAAYPAESGAKALEILEKTEGIDAVLMDIMMPGMDGYETTRAIRGIDRFQALPILAVTAKAMAGDREKCLDAGCSDYLPKPVIEGQLLSLLRVWLCK